MGVRLTLFLQPRDGIFHMQADFTSHIFLTFHNKAFHAPRDRETIEAEKCPYSPLLQRTSIGSVLPSVAKTGAPFARTANFQGLSQEV